jgi:uncharacterized protein involved in exopolysaccharide biosynthesis
MLTNQGGLLNSNRSQNDILAGFLYINALQQNLDLRNKINNQILDYNTEMENSKNSSKNIQIQIDILSKEIEDLKQKRDKINIIQVVQPPTSSPYPINSNVKRNTMLAGAVGLFLMLILAFFIETINKYKKREPR